MLDTRFYESLGPIRLADLAAKVGAQLSAPHADADVPIAAVASLDRRADGPGAVGFLESPKLLSSLEAVGLEACFVKPALAEAVAALGVRPVISDRPHLAFAAAVDALIRPLADDFGPGVHPAAEIGPGVTLGPGALVAKGARIGAGTRIGPNAVIGGGVEIGPDGEIGAGVVVHMAVLGARARIHANAVIGESGYGLVQGGGELIERPHVGRVLIGNDVRIGACTTVDRGALIDTTVGDGSKIDNLVQIAHNVRIGKRCIIAGCTGISGSVVIGDDAVLGGSVGVADHVTIGAGARLSGATLVMRDVPGGEAWAGAPARPIRQFFREIVALEKLARGGPAS